MQLQDYLRALRRNWVPLTACLTLGAIAAAALSFLLPRAYTSETKLFVSMQAGSSVTELQQGSTFAQSRIISYVDAVTTASVLQPVIDDLDLAVSVDELSEQVSATAPADSVIINISATSSAPEQAARISDAVAESLIETVRSVESPQNPSDSPVQLSVLQPAEAALKPSSPNFALNMFVGLIAGLILGLAFAIVRELLDTRIRSEHDIAKITTAPTLGAIMFDEDAVRHPLVTQVSSLSPRAESFRRVRTNLEFVQVDSANKTVLVTSSIQGEGKTSTSANLALSLASSNHRVAIIEGDLRRPRLSRYFGMDNTVGLTTVLLGQIGLEDALQPWGDGQLFVLSSGRVPPNPAELLGSPKMRELMADLDSRFDFVIIDGPPLLPVTDSAVLSQLAGGVVVVVSVKDVKNTELPKALETLSRVEANVLGIIINKAAVRGPDAYNYAYQYTESFPDTYSSKKRGSKTSAASRSSEKSANRYPVAELDTPEDGAAIESPNPVDDPAPHVLRASDRVTMSSTSANTSEPLRLDPSHDLTDSDVPFGSPRRSAIVPDSSDASFKEPASENSRTEFDDIVFSPSASETGGFSTRGRHSR